jgi:hypothetical protein
MTMLTAYLSGFVLALAVSAYAMLIGLDRDRAFYPTVLIVVAAYYVLFAVMGGEVRTLIEESLIAGCFLLVATMGFKRSSWLIVVALAAHGLLDLVHGSVVSNGGVPPWWPAFCMTYDLTAAGFLAWTLHRSPSLSRPRDRAGS